MGLIKWLASSISENMNLETNLELEQELSLLQEKHDELESENNELFERLATSGDNFEKLAKENKELVTENDRLLKNYNELRTNRDSVKLRETCIILQKKLNDSERMRKLNFSLSQAKIIYF